jgi:quercetin dioxygenase-like cupin family protein
MAATPTSIGEHPVHLGLGATVVPLPRFTGDLSWYEEYTALHGDDGAEGRLVSMHTFTGPWDVWEVHPHGDELVLCTSGTITLHQEVADGTVQQTTLSAGQYAINPPGVWHTADVEGEATALFVTAGLGTEHRPR